MLIPANKFMSMAMEQAEIAYNVNEVPVGAVIVENLTGKVIAKAHNLVENLCNPLAHAEILAIKKASKILGSKLLLNCDIYVTLEPCIMCAQAISFARLKRLYFAAHDSKYGGVENGPNVFSSSSCHHSPEIYGGINYLQSKQLLTKFFQNLRKNS